MPSVEGVAAFSCPFFVEQVEPTFVERGFVSVLFSNGSLQLFGVESGAPTRVIEMPNRTIEAMPLVNFGISGGSCDVPLLAFEGLINVMDSEEVVVESADLDR
jgi:hypothetical protein